MRNAKENRHAKHNSFDKYVDWFYVSVRVWSKVHDHRHSLVYISSIWGHNFPTNFPMKNISWYWVRSIFQDAVFEEHDVRAMKFELVAISIH